MKKMMIIFIVLLIIPFLFILFALRIQLENQEKFKQNFQDKLALREELIEKIDANEIKIDENNNAILTEKYHGVALNNYVHIFVCNEKEKVIEFYYDAGFPDEAQSIFYSSKDEELIKKYVKEHLYAYIEKIKDNWYLVQYS